jgi:hypothetical protein
VSNPIGASRSPVAGVSFRFDGGGWALQLGGRRYLYPGTGVTISFDGRGLALDHFDDCVCGRQTAQRKAAEVVQLRGQSVRPEEIAAKLGISRVSVFPVLKAQGLTRLGARHPELLLEGDATD